MRRFFKQIAYLLLSLAIVNISIQTVYASPLHECEKAEMMDMHGDNMGNMEHCNCEDMTQKCSCSDCGCNMHMTTQVSIVPQSKTFLHNLLASKASIYQTVHYSLHLDIPLLRPPIT